VKLVDHVRTATGRPVGIVAEVLAQVRVKDTAELEPATLPMEEAPAPQRLTSRRSGRNGNNQQKLWLAIAALSVVAVIALVGVVWAVTQTAAAPAPQPTSAQAPSAKPPTTPPTAAQAPSAKPPIPQTPTAQAEPIPAPPANASPQPPPPSPSPPSATPGLSSPMAVLNPSPVADLDPQLIGHVIDDGGGSFNHSPLTADKAFDGDITSFYDAALGSDGFTGIDLGPGHAATITAIRFYTRSFYADRMNGGVFEGSNDPTSGYVTLATVTSASDAGWNTLTVAGAAPYRYLRYRSSSGGHCDVAEIEFHGRK